MGMKTELYNDNFQNFKKYNIPKAQLVIADIPYNLGVNAYASSTEWYIDGDNRNGESNKAGKAFFNTDVNFNIAEYMHFCNRLLKKEPKERGKAPAMIVFCAFDQMQTVISYGKKYGFMHSYPLFFIKNYSAQVLKEARTERMYFAYDTPNDYDPLVEAGRMLTDAGFTPQSHVMACYNLIGYRGDTFDKAQSRLEQTIMAGFMPYAMLYRDQSGQVDREWAKFQREWLRPAIVSKKFGEVWHKNE